MLANPVVTVAVTVAVTSETSSLCYYQCTRVGVAAADTFEGEGGHSGNIPTHSPLVQ